jgi:hypothetical protein
MVVLSVASSGASIVSQMRAAKAQNAAITQTLERTETDTRGQATAQVNERLRESRREQGRIKVAAGEAGLQLTGSVQSLLNDSVMQTTLANERTVGNARRNLEGARAEANSAYSRVESPSALGAGLQLATAAMQGYSAGKSLQITRAQAGKT